MLVSAVSIEKFIVKQLKKTTPNMFILINVYLKNINIVKVVFVTFAHRIRYFSN